MKENLLVIDADYTIANSVPTVRLFCKNEKGKIVLVLDQTFNPYFYAMPKEGKINQLKEKIEGLDTKKIGAKILKIEIVEKNWEGEKTKLVKITIDNPRRIPDVRNEIKNWEEVKDIFEYDIVFHKRYLIDKQIEPMSWISVEGKETENKEGYKIDRIIEASSVKPIKLEKEIEFRILAFDTEWIEEDGKSKLIMLSLVCSDKLKKVLTCCEWKKKPSYVETFKNEKEMIERFLEIVEEKDPDFLVGYNSDGFDVPKLKDKSTELKIPLKLGRDNTPVHVVRRGRISSAKTKGRVHIDLFNFIDHILSASMRSEVLTLDEVAQELLGIGKKEMKYKEMVEIWSEKEQLERLAEYSLNDSVLTLKLAEYILPQIFVLCRVVGGLPFDICRNTYSQLLEFFLMRRTFIDNVLIPNRPKTEEIERRRMFPVYKGAIVKEPIKGIHSDILVFDFKSMYPTIIITYNISPETLNCRCCKDKKKLLKLKWHFCQKKKGFIPKHLEGLIKKRKEVKEKIKKVKKGSKEWKRLDNQQYALKILSNACYGYTGYVGAKWYCRECAEATAAIGRELITKIIKSAEKERFIVVYGDTDSVFLKIKG